MAFFDFIFKKRKNTEPRIEDDLTFENFRVIMVQYQGKHIVYEIKQGLITYKNIISPRNAGCRFPEGYFDVKTVALPENARKKIHRLIGIVTSQLSFSDTLDLLPPGASREALIKCTKNTGDPIYYTNCHLSESGFSIRTEPVSALFLELFNTLSSFCEFDDAAICPHID